MTADFADWYRGRRVLVTGHTGFTGSWLCHWLLDLGAEVSGYALAPATSPALFDLLRLGERMDHRTADVRDADTLARHFRTTRPEVVLHLAAQPLVRESYRDPQSTWATNVMGTVHVLEAARACGTIRACVAVTSDKCYDNRNWQWGYRECDPLGGHDPYSASKGAAELAVASWRHSFAGTSGLRLASARAGNAIGGGDWSAERLVPDFIRAVQQGRSLELRHPAATRPWQHVLEPVSGYLLLAWMMAREGGSRFAEAWNFGPLDETPLTVGGLAQLLSTTYGAGSVASASGTPPLPEAAQLKLDCSKARAALGWHAAWRTVEAVERTAAWYRNAQDGATAVALTNSDLAAYRCAGRQQGLPWATGHRTSSTP